MKNILFFIILVIAAGVAYSYFLGKDEDKERAENVINETKDLGRSVGDFIKRQKEKYDNGEFDKLTDRIKNAIDKIRSRPAKDKKEVNHDLKELESELKRIDADKLSEENKVKLRQILQDLEKEIDESD